MKTKKPKSKTPKALVLFSGGLDSRLAIKLLQQQNLEVEAVHIKLPFGAGCCTDESCVINYSQVQGAKLYIIDATKPPLFNEFLKIIKNPKHGTGTAMNPCKDCKIFLLKQAKKLAKKIGANIIATGEVLSQRPMSQLKHQLELTEKKAGLKNKVLRPLSAKLLPPTDYQKSGIINNDNLLNLKGRQRKIQMQLAKKYKLKYPSPGGGCLLCEKQYALKLKDLFEHKPLKKIKPQDIQLLSIGRHFRKPKSKGKKGKIILGKDNKENLLLENLNKTLKYNILIPTLPGPTALYENKTDLKLVKELIKTYSKGSTEKDRRKFEGWKI